MTDYDPVYFSRLYAWQNDINHSDKLYVKRIKDIEFVEKMLSQFLDLMRSKQIDDMAIRQGILIWLNGGITMDYELKDFDKKVIKDVEAHLRENIGPELG
jgi:hypothetical protein